MAQQPAGRKIAKNHFRVVLRHSKPQQIARRQIAASGPKNREFLRK